MQDQDVMNLLRELAANNGSYGRLLQLIEHADEQTREQWLKQF